MAFCEGRRLLSSVMGPRPKAPLDLDAVLAARIAFDGRICMSLFKDSRRSQALWCQVLCFHVYKSCD